MEFIVNMGKGYVPAAANRPEDAPIGLIPVDAIYSPVKRVSYKVEPTRVGQVTDYDKLLLTVETNGAVTPEDAVALAARILQDRSARPHQPARAGCGKTGIVHSAKAHHFF